MRHLLSYRHARLNTPGGLIETDYLLSVPLVVCTLSAFHSSTATSQQPLTTEALATLTEEFTVFMDKRPDYMKSTQGPSLADLSKKTGALLRKVDPKLAYAIENFRVAQRELGALEKDVSRLRTVLSILLHSIVRSMFVGYMPMESVLHAWDLIILGFDQPRYDPVPYICTSMLALLHNDLIKCQTEKEAETAIIKGCRNIREERLKVSIAQMGFEQQMKESLNIAEEGQFPVFHPALKSTLPPWKHWYSSKLIAHIQNEKNETTVKPLLSMPSRPVALSPASDRAGNDRDEQMWELEQTKLKLEEENGMWREEREALIGEIEEERRLRVEMQEHADDEIERLRRQLHAMRRTPAVVPLSPEVAGSDTFSVHAPPPTAATSEVMSPPPVPTPPTKPESVHEETEPEAPVDEIQEEEAPKTPVHEPSSAKEEEALKTTNDFLQKMMDGISQLAHGSGKSRKELDQMTRKDYQKFMTAMNKAQISVFGKSMTDSDIERLPTPERNEKVTQVREETVKKLFHIK